MIAASEKQNEEKGVNEKQRYCTFLPFREIFGFGNLVEVIDTCRTSEESFR
jgi:hypothetical protein